MIIVLPFYSGDAWLAAKNLLWWTELDGKVPYEAILSCDTKTDAAEVTGLAKQFFKKVHQFRYEPLRENKWPLNQNHAFNSLCWHIYHNFPKQSFLWVETDSIALSPGWIQAIEACHIAGKKPFTGHWNYATGVFNGVAVYPPNISRYSQRAMMATMIEGNQPPWDVYCSKEVEPHLNKANHLFQHIWRDDATGEAHHFTTTEQVARVVREGVVLFHRDKTGSIIDVLRGTGPSLYTARKTVEADKTIHVQRTASIGDVISASVVVDKLIEKGFKVIYHCDPTCSIPLAGKYALALPIDKPDINLDGAYENHPDRKSKHRNHIFIDVANSQLQSRGLRLDYANAAPEIPRAGESRLQGPKPHIVAVPRSNSFVNKTVTPDVWSEAAVKGPGTWFWSGTDPAPAGFVDLQCRDLPHLMAAIANADIVVSVDTGPLHIAAAMKVPIVAIEQSVSVDIGLSDQRDYSTISPALGCINCQQHKCPINEHTPPCGKLSAEELVASVRSKWQATNGSTVSAIIPIYKPNVERLNKCLTHVLPQVDEIVISVDGDGAIPVGVVQSRRIKWIQNPTGQRQGFGKTVNRAARQSSGRFMLMLNDDVYLKPDAVAKLKAAMDEKTAIVAGRLWYPDGTIQHGGGYRNPGDVGWGHLDVKRKIPTIRKKTELEFVTLAAAFIRREAFYQARAFDERYDCYCEDSELCLQVRKNGWRITYEPLSEGVHDESQTTGAMKKELGKASYAIFRDRWMEYFTRNRDNQMGTFA